MVKIGDIFRCSWGYEQTNVDYYVVVKVTKKMVTLQEIGSEVTKECGWASCYVKPDPTRIIGKPFRRKFNTYGENQVYVSINSFSGATRVDKDSESLQTSYY